MHNSVSLCVCVCLITVSSNFQQTRFTIKLIWLFVIALLLKQTKQLTILILLVEQICCAKQSDTWINLINSDKTLLKVSLTMRRRNEQQKKNWSSQYFIWFGERKIIWLKQMSTRPYFPQKIERDPESISTIKLMV